MPGFWTLIGPSLVVFLVLGTVLVWGSILAVRWFKLYAVALRDLEEHLKELIESRSKTLAPKRLEELESFCNTLREEFSKLVALNQEWKSDSYRKVQRYATMIDKKLRSLDGVQFHNPNPAVDEDAIDDVELAAAEVGGPAAEVLPRSEETIESVRAAFYGKAKLGE